MNAETRQTLIGVAGLTAVQLMALHEGYNGRVTMAYMVAVLAIVAPQALGDIGLLGGSK